jgi:hypothetical protein
MKKSVKRTRRSKSRTRTQKGGAVFTTQEKDNLIRDGGFTQEQLDYLASLPENFRRDFGSVTQSDYDFIKDWQKSVSELYDIPFTPENMKEISSRTIEDFKYHYDRARNQDQAFENMDNSIISSVNENEQNISELPSFFGGKSRRNRRKKSRKSRRKH